MTNMYQIFLFLSGEGESVSWSLLNFFLGIMKSSFACGVNLRVRRSFVSDSRAAALIHP